MVNGHLGIGSKKEIAKNLSSLWMELIKNKINTVMNLLYLALTLVENEYEPDLVLAMKST